MQLIKSCAVSKFFHLNDVLRLHDPGLSISNIIWLGGSAFTDVV